MPRAIEWVGRKLAGLQGCTSVVSFVEGRPGIMLLTYAAHISLMISRVAPLCAL